MKKILKNKKFIYTVRTMLIVLTASIVCIVLKSVGVEKENVLVHRGMSTGSSARS